MHLVKNCKQRLMLLILSQKMKVILNYQNKNPLNLHVQSNFPFCYFQSPQEWKNERNLSVLAQRSIFCSQEVTS